MAADMRIEVTTRFETSHVGNNSTEIVARILKADGTEIARGSTGDYHDSMKLDDAGRPTKVPADAKRAVQAALDSVALMLANAREVAAKAGLL
jgi:hypothetical protein